MDTWLAGDDPNNRFHHPTPPHQGLNAQQYRHYSHNPLVSHSKKLLSSNSNVGSHYKQNYYPSESTKFVTSTISRYACRILMDREQTNKAYVYAAGFDSSKNIFLGEKATKWQKKNGECDGLTTNGILILHPNRCIEVR